MPEWQSETSDEGGHVAVDISPLSVMCRRNLRQPILRRKPNENRLAHTELTLLKVAG